MRQNLSKTIGAKRIVGLLIPVLLGLSIFPFAIPPARAVATAITGYKVADYVTGFPNDGSVGPIGIAMDAQKNLYVGDFFARNVYKFPRTGSPFVASSSFEFVSTSTLSPPTQPFNFNPHGLAIASNGSIYLNLVHSSNTNDGEVVRLIGPNMLRVVACGILWPSGLAVDPLSGDLFVSQSGLGSNIYRIPIKSSTCSSGTPPVFAVVQNADGLVFGPDGTLYAASAGSKVVEIDRNGSPTSIASISTADGITISRGQNPEFLYTNNNDGTITKIYLDPVSGTIPPPVNIVTGGSRGDFDTVGADRCLYATQTDRVLVVSNSDGSCRPSPFGELFQNNPSVESGLFTSSGTSIAVGSAVAQGSSVYDTARVNGNSTLAPTGNVIYTFYSNGRCFGSGMNQTVVLTSGIVPNSATQPSLANGDYSFQANYNGDSNYFPSTSACEWFTVGSDYDLISSGSISAPEGGSGSNSIVATLTSGTSSSVSLSCASGLPAGASCSFNPASGLASFTSALTIAASSTTPTGWSTITITGTGGGLTRITRFLLTVTPPSPPTVGGVLVPVDKLGLLAPYIGFASIIVAATVLATVYVTRKSKEKKMNK